MRKYLSLFPGLGAAAGIKLLTARYRYNSHQDTKYCSECISSEGSHLLMIIWSRTIVRHLSTRLGKRTRNQSCTQLQEGSYLLIPSVIGVGEIVLLPLDALKIKMQISSSAYAGKSALDIFREEGWTLYRGASWTAARNAPGMFH